MPSEKIASTVVTSETRHDFMSKKLNLEPTAPITDATGIDTASPGGDGKDNSEAKDAEPGTEKKVETTEVKAEEKEVKKEETTEDKDKKKNALNQRFSELAHERDEAKRLADEERQKREATEIKVRELEDRLRPKPVDPI